MESSDDIEMASSEYLETIDAMLSRRAFLRSTMGLGGRETRKRVAGGDEQRRSSNVIGLSVSHSGVRSYGLNIPADIAAGEEWGGKEGSREEGGEGGEGEGRNDEG